MQSICPSEHSPEHVSAAQPVPSVWHKGKDPLHAVSQQTAPPVAVEMQFPEVHWFELIQLWPFDFLLRQLSAALQYCVLALQFAAQVPPQPLDVTVVLHAGQLGVQHTPLQHWFGEPQLAPHSPPHPSAEEVVLHEGQFGVQQVPPLQTPEPVQLAGHMPPHPSATSDVRHGGQLGVQHVPPAQTSGHCVPHALQFSRSVCVLVQVPSQHVSFDAQSEVRAQTFPSQWASPQGAGVQVSALQLGYWHPPVAISQTPSGPSVQAASSGW